jgi:hypothetical protein
MHGFASPFRAVLSPPAAAVAQCGVRQLAGLMCFCRALFTDLTLVVCFLLGRYRLEAKPLDPLAVGILLESQWEEYIWPDDVRCTYNNDILRHFADH